MKKKKAIIWGTGAGLLILLVAPIICIWVWGCEKSPIDVPQLLYYTYCVLGSIATACTVIYALFSYKIKDFLYSEEIEVCIDEDGFKEDVVNEDEADVKVEKYHCDLLLKNIGAKPVKKCELRITSITHKTANKSGKSKNLMPKELSFLRVPICGEAKNSILERQSLLTPILSIIPETKAGTPANDETTPLHLEILGHNFNGSNANQGSWCIKYTLQTSDKIIKNFEVNLSWTGQWRGRLTEMKNEITIKIC